ncbi:uncharacterized protein si:ch211-127m7.2 isoform X2 [Phyllopteryx taeniolatus]|uniref:uncharacterized protein si:ch211-127m7.2 isoform X2 n=1 Tax=Phyllopteryx taeniolatus TaxID=161469 RepID=UPI002AD2E7D6|nr:uncharacterized protein si:ch211-127m7.2 isoform X2 [Phyllopteryx taeniolatus]
MSERRRALPSWMSKMCDEGKEKQPLKTTRKKKVARAVFYCMNTNELLEAAAAYLGYQHGTPLFGQQVTPFPPLFDITLVPAQSKMKDAARKSVSSVKRTGKQVALEKEAVREETYVSETDLDVAEMETVPYTGSDQKEEDEARQQTAKTEKQHLTENQGGDDAMRLVREIFFT